MITKVLVVIGGVNWGLVGLGMLLGHQDEWNVVRMVLGSMPLFEAVIYILVGISAFIVIFDCKCKKCSSNSCCTCVDEKVEEVSLENKPESTENI